MPLSNMDARHVIMHYKQKGERVDEVLRSVVLNHVSRLEHENQRLRKALEFYADESNYKRIMLSILTPKVLFDDGEIARKVLEVD